MPSCDQSRIGQFLQHELSRAEQQEFEQHLEVCDACCHRLHDSTADPTWWDEASRFLPDQVDDLERLTQAVVGADTASARPSIDGIDDAAERLTPPAVQNVLRLLAPTDNPNMLGRIGTYEVAGVVGAGGMSVVLKAFDSSLNRYVAVKVLAPHLATSGAARQRFAREAQAAAAIVHENVIAIHGVDDALGLPYLAKPYVKGQSLQKRLDAEGPLELKEILRIAKQTASGLAAAHAQGLIHRDVKPANILLAEGVERVTITDFGLARAADDASLTRTGTIAGTPQYMSPEQARGETVDQRSDLFSLGSVIYAMCTGRAPFRADSSYGVLRRISDANPRRIRDINPEIPSWLCRLVRRLHAKSPQDRYSTAAEVAADLEQCLAHVQQPWRMKLPPSLADSALRRIGSKTALPVAVGIAVLVLIALVSTLPDRRAPNSSTSASSTPHTRADESKSDERSGNVVDAPVEIPRESVPDEDRPVLPDEMNVPLDHVFRSDAGSTEWEDGTELELLELDRATSWLEEQLQLELGADDHSAVNEFEE